MEIYLMICLAILCLLVGWQAFEIDACRMKYYLLARRLEDLDRREDKILDIQVNHLRIFNEHLDEHEEKAK